MGLGFLRIVWYRTSRDNNYFEIVKFLSQEKFLDFDEIGLAYITLLCLIKSSFYQNLLLTSATILQPVTKG